MNDFTSISDALEAFKKGGMLIVVDDEDRENEGDLILAADFATPELINFMIKEARGLVCTPLPSALAQKLNLPLMVEKNNSPHHTAFTVSIDASHGISTGISAFDRAYTINLLTNPQVTALDFTRPGHIFPLISHPQGLNARQGHTEASLELCKLSGLSEVAVICEILNDDGSMARLPELKTFAKKFNLPLITIKDLIFHSVQASQLLIEVDSHHVDL